MSQLHVVCPHCHTTNRVQSDDLANGPDCGSCHQALFTGEPANLGATEFDRHVTRSQLPVLVDFWAPWCGPCRMMAPAFEQAASQLEPRMQLAKVNTDEAPGVGARLNIRSIPTIALFVGGREVARQAGAMGANDIVRWAQSQLARAATAV
jgi:thioredoxin 2